MENKKITAKITYGGLTEEVKKKICSDYVRVIRGTKNGSR